MALASEVWRDYVTDGVPASGPHRPVKADIRAWGTGIEGVGFAVPGVSHVPLFSNGLSAVPVYRAIIGADLPNPSLLTAGGVFALPGAAGQVLSGIGTDGSPDVATVTGTGDVMLSASPSISGILKHGALNLIGSAGGTHIFYAPDGRLAVQLGDTGNPNFYKAATHAFYNATGSDQFLNLDQYTTELLPFGLTSALDTSALKITQTWNTTGLPMAIDLSITRTAADAGARLLRLRAGAAGTTRTFDVDPLGNVWTLADVEANGFKVAASGITVATPQLMFTSPVDFNTANTDYAITIKLPAGYTRYRLASASIVNTGTTASLTTATFGIFTDVAAGGTAIVASGTALSPLTSNAAQTAGALFLATIATASTMYFTDTTLFFRTQTAQGAAASGLVAVQIIPLG